MAPFFTSFEIPTSPYARKAWKRYSIAVLATALAVSFRLILNEYVPNILPYFFFYPAVMLSVWYGGLRPGLLAAFLSFIFVWNAFSPPFFSFHLANSQDTANLILFLFVNLCICLLTENLHRSYSKNRDVSVELLASQRRIRDILESIQGCFFTIDVNGEVLHINKECEKYLSIPRSNFYGKNIWDVLSSWANSVLHENVQKSIKDQQGCGFEFYDPDKGRWHEVHLSPSSDGISIHLFDLTPRKTRERRQTTEYAVTQILNVESSPATAIPKILEVMAENLGWDFAAYWGLDTEDQRLTCQYTWTLDSQRAERLIDVTRSFRFARGEGQPGIAWLEDRLCWEKQVTQHPEWYRYAALTEAGICSGLAIPLKLGKALHGVMEFFSHQELDPDPDLINMYEAMGREIGLFLDRCETEEKLRLAYEEMEKKVEDRTAELAQANEYLRAEMRERRKVEREAIEIIQDEQRKMSAQLHDGLCQNLTGAMMMAKAAMQKLEKKSIPEAIDLKPVIESMDRSVSEARDLARGLFPVELEANSLMLSLRVLASRTEQLFKVPCSFHCPEPILIADYMAATNLYRLAQEAIHNSIQHGNAKHLELGLVRSGANIELWVKDDGDGLSQDLRFKAGIGLHIMNYRARMMDATLNFEALPSGTIFRCILPGSPEESGEKEASFS